MSFRPSARILARSVSPLGDEVTTFEIVTNRFILSEFNTHRTLSRNSASSRAIPILRQVEMLREEPALPLVWASEKRGMQGGEPLDADAEQQAVDQWLALMETAIETALGLRDLGLHKSLTNRLLEPWMAHRIVVTGTAFQNFYEQRDSALAQPEIAAVARCMLDAYDASETTVVKEGEWHLPYVTDRDVETVQERDDLRERADIPHLLAQISSARCARTSYLTNPVTDATGQVIEEARVDIDKDVILYDRLVTAQPKHWSPLEHPATPWAVNKQTEPVPFEINGQWHHAPTAHLPRVGNLYGWRSLRTETETVLDEVTYR